MIDRPMEAALSSPTDPLSRLIVTDLVRLVAAGTGFTTIARFGEQDGPVPVALTQQFPPRDIHDARHPDYRPLLHGAASQERRSPSQLCPWAVALILPERDIAYLRYGDEPLTVLTVGPHPHDDPATRAIVADGLDALMGALLDGQPSPRPHGRPFSASAPHATPSLPHPPGWPLEHGPGERHGPHR